MLDLGYRMRVRFFGYRLSGYGHPMGLALLILSLASCVSGRLDSENSLHYLSLDRSEVFAPPRNPASQESIELQRTLQQYDRDPGSLSRDARSACVLRLAYLELRLGEVSSSSRLLNSLFRQSPAPRTQALVLAHLLRADIAERKSDAGRALAELQAAERLSRDPRDRNEIDRRRHRLAMIHQKPAKVETAPKSGSASGAVAKAWTGKAGSVVLLERKEWGSQKEVPARLDRMTKIHRVTIHHTAMLAASSSSANAAQIRAIQRRHIRTKGWGDLGYHFMIGRDGKIYEGRRLRYQGAHAGDAASNKGNVGICLLGDYSRGQQTPSATQLRALQKLTAALCTRYGIPPSGILTHKEVRPGHNTVCPGAFLTTVVQNMRNAYRLNLARRVE